MRFADPFFLYGLGTAVLLAGFLIWAMRRRRRLLERFAESHLLDEVAGRFNPQRVALKSGLVLLVFIFGVLALARPQWGFEWQEIKRRGLDILVAVDTSKSMLTRDVKPTRLERSKLAVRDLLKGLAGDRVGLIAFAGSAFLVCPLTVDYGGFLLSLQDLDTATIPRGGTNLSGAVDEALQEYEQVPSRYKALIILTDGENLEGEPLKAAAKAKEKGLKIYCVGVGTPEGELIQTTDPFGNEGFVKDAQGNFVKSRLNEKLLQEIALTTGGIYVRAGGAVSGLDLIYERELSKWEKRDIESEMEKKYHERFQIPLGLALILLAGEACLSTSRKMKNE